MIIADLWLYMENGIVNSNPVIAVKINNKIIRALTLCDARRACSNWARVLAIVIPALTGPNFIKPVSIKNNTEKSCLTETGSEPKFHKVYMVRTGAPLNFC